LPEAQSMEEGLASVAKRLFERLDQEPANERRVRLMTDALLLAGLRVRRDTARTIFRGIRAMQESDTYLMILDEGQEKEAKKAILIFGEELFGPPEESVKARLNEITDLARLERMIRRTAKAASWEEILATP
jgi:hypothetical protein